MNIAKLREIQKVIYNIYYNNEDPVKFKELTGLENYMEELYPSDPEKIFGDWIEENFDTKVFLDPIALQKGMNDLNTLFKRAFYYANLPDGKNLTNFIEQSRQIIKGDGDIISGSEEI